MGFFEPQGLLLNCTLKKTPELSHTEGLMKIVQAIMETNGVQVELLRAVDHDIAHGVYPDMPGLHLITREGSKRTIKRRHPG